MANTSFIISAHSERANTTLSNSHPEANTILSCDGFPSPASFANIADAQKNANNYALFLRTLDYQGGYDWKGKAKQA